MVGTGGLEPPTLAPKASGEVARKQPYRIKFHIIKYLRMNHRYTEYRANKPYGRAVVNLR